MVRKVKFISVPVRDQDRALEFYVGTLGFKLLTDQPMGPGQRWVEVRPPKGETGIALFTPPGQEDRIYNGANDDGSGTVSVIELASALATAEPRPRRSLLFMTFVGEE